ncbi:MAG: metalloregulator ArsR/SmtB family transcription factor [Coriobacteriia bacterium]|nr:metalloregulator ArsR/SmtB family transcription factor [Coriobacteriia bacterium]
MTEASATHDCAVMDAANAAAALDDQGFARVAHALAHPARVAIVRRLSACDECVAAEIFDEIDLAQSTVSEHLRVLREAEVVRSSAQGNRTYYCIDRVTLARYQRTLEGMAPTGVDQRP